MRHNATKIQEAVRSLNLEDARDRKKFNDALQVMGKGSNRLSNFLLYANPNVGSDEDIRKAFDAIEKEQEQTDLEILDILES